MIWFEKSYQRFSIWAKQSHYIEVVQGDIVMEQEMWFGLVLGRLAIMKKRSLGRLWATFEDSFFMFSVAKKIFFLFFLPPKTWKNCPQIGLNSQSIVYCSIGDTSLRDFYIVTLEPRDKWWAHHMFSRIPNFLFVLICSKWTFI